jgi:hypothetical protein
MSLYVHPENQKILWNSIHKTPQFQQLPTHVKEQFFKSVIQIFYEKYKHVNLNSESLRQLNKDTILIMIHKLKEMNGSSSTGPPHTETHQHPYAASPSPLLNNYMTPSFSTVNPNVMVSKDSEKGERRDVYSRMFQDRQKEYQLMNAKPTIPEVNFKENVEDEPISGDSMSKLIERHLKEREIEVGMAYYPSNIVPPPTPTTPAIISTLQPSVTVSSTPPPPATVPVPVPTSTPIPVPIPTPVSQPPIDIVTPQVISQIEELTYIYKNIQNDIQELKKTIETYFQNRNGPFTPHTVTDTTISNPILQSSTVNPSIELLKEELSMEDPSSFPASSSSSDRVHFELTSIPG